MNTTAVIIFGSLFIFLHLINFICSCTRVDIEEWPIATTIEFLCSAIGMICGCLMIISQTISAPENLHMLLYSISFSLTFFMNGVIASIMGIREGYYKKNPIVVNKYWHTIKWILLGVCLTGILSGIIFGAVFN